MRKMCWRPRTASIGRGGRSFSPYTRPGGRRGTPASALHPEGRRRKEVGPDEKGFSPHLYLADIQEFPRRQGLPRLRPEEERPGRVRGLELFQDLLHDGPADGIAKPRHVAIAHGRIRRIDHGAPFLVEHEDEGIEKIEAGARLADLAERRLRAVL